MALSPDYHIGDSLLVQNAGEPWSLTFPDPYTFRLELKQGDHYPDDYSTSVQRTQVKTLQPAFHQGDAINVHYGLTVEPGAASTSNWQVLNQINLLDNPQIPPFEIDLVNGDRMQVSIRNPSNGDGEVIWTDPNPIQRGHEYQMNVQLKFGTDGYL